LIVTLLDVANTEQHAHAHAERVAEAAGAVGLDVLVDDRCA
jgi:hypothetical protein